MTLSRKSIDFATAPYFEKWKELAIDLHGCLTERKEDCRSLVESGHHLYKDLQSLLAKMFGENRPAPLNEEDRLAFVMNSRSTHAAYRQLEQLFAELKKKVAREKIRYPEDR